jgi:hypothetical protein
MQTNHQHYSTHARQRCEERAIPRGIVDLILQYGEPIKARDEARKFCISKKGLRQIKRDYGPEISRALTNYRNVYIVLSEGCVVTVARSAKPLVH